MHKTISEPADYDQSEVNAGAKTLPDSHTLFNFSSDIYSGSAVSPAIISKIESLIYPGQMFYGANDGSFACPGEYRALLNGTVRSVVMNDSGAIFCKRIYHDDYSMEFLGSVFATHLGVNVQNADVMVGIINTTCGGIDDIHRTSFLNLIGLIKRYYREFTEVRGIREYISNCSSIRYVIDPLQSRVVARRLPARFDSDMNLERLDRMVMAQILPGLMASSERIEPLTVGHDQFKNFSISKCRVRDFDYVLISFYESSVKDANREVSGREARKLNDISDKKTVTCDSGGRLTVRNVRPDTTSVLLSPEAAEPVDQQILHSISPFDSYESQQSEDTGSVNLGRLISTLMETKQGVAGRGISLEFHDNSEAVSIRADNKVLGDAIAEILSFAMKLAREGGNIRVHLGKSGEMASVSIECHPDSSGTRPSPDDYLKGGISGFREGSTDCWKGMVKARRILACYGAGISEYRNRDGSCTIKIAIPASDG
jgi:hypothetical protein